MRYGYLVGLAYLTFCVPSVASAQLYESVGIRAQGMGGAFVAVADDATATWWNPAGLATGPFFDALIEYDRIRTTPQQRVTGVAVALPSLGLSYYRVPIGDADHLSVYGVTFGQSLGEHVVVASTLKLDRVDDGHGDLDLGALARFGHAQLGISVKNVRRPELQTSTGSVTLDRQARAGVALLGRSNGWIKEMTLALDADLVTTRSRPGGDQVATGSVTSGDVRHVAGGLELWLLNKQVGVRGGASINTVGDKGSSASAGVSLAVRSGLYIDAHHSNGSDRARKTWGVALRSTF